MPSSEADRVHTIEDFADFLAGVAEEGCEAVVIGGIAVAAYARLMGEELYSVDVDLYTDKKNLSLITRWMSGNGGIVHKRPRVRNIPVAFIEWDGKEVNVLLGTNGLPSPDRVYEDARAFRLPQYPEIPILVADPYNLLANKLKVNRPKDRPHIDVLMRFIEAEAEEWFRTENDPRKRIQPGRKLLKVLETKILPETLAARLIPLARTVVDYRFLASHVPLREHADALRQRAAETEWEQEVAAILAHRRFRG